MPHLAILLCAVSVFLLGAPWYFKAMFLRPWARANGIDPDAPRDKHSSLLLINGGSHVVQLTPYGLILGHRH